MRIWGKRHYRNSEVNQFLIPRIIRFHLRNYRLTHILKVTTTPYRLDHCNIGTMVLWSEVEISNYLLNHHARALFAWLHHFCKQLSP